MTTLTFKNHQIDLITQDNCDWIKGASICHPLGYKNEGCIRRIYTRNKNEFISSMVKKLKIKTNGGIQEVLAFSLRGAHLLAMFSRTPVAKEFRKWVLDVLEEKINSSSHVPCSASASHWNATSSAHGCQKQQAFNKEDFAKRAIEKLTMKMVEQGIISKDSPIAQEVSHQLAEPRSNWSEATRGHQKYSQIEELTTGQELQRIYCRILDLQAIGLDMQNYQNEIKGAIEQIGNVFFKGGLPTPRKGITHV